jgi:O-antigen/teichoic acid export membrane protein
VNAVQGLLVMLVSLAGAFVPAAVLGIEPELERDFRWLMAGQGVLLGVNFAARILMHVLVAHHRYDVVNCSQALSVGVSFGVAFGCFAAGLGVFSMLWGQLASLLCTVGIQAVGCVRQKLLPAAGQWGRVSWARFRELFDFGKDVFLFSVGSQLIFFSQTIVITRWLGLDAGAVWSVCTRTFNLGTQLVYRIFDFSCPAIAEMIVRGERERLFQRFRSIVMLTTTLGLLAAVLVAACNGSFVAWWTGGRAAWPMHDNGLLALWLLICVVSHAHIGLVGQTKEFGFLRWIYFLEGVLFVGLSMLTVRRGGFSAMIVASITASLVCSFPYSIWRTQRYFGLAASEVLWDWSRPAFRLALWVAPLAAAAWLLTQFWRVQIQFLVCSLSIGGVGALLLLRVGLDPQLRGELSERAPGKLRPVVAWLVGKA